MKKLLIILGCVLALLGVTAGILVATAKGRVIGTWEGYAGYLSVYDCDIIFLYELRSDGTVTQSMQNADTEGIVDIHQGTWTMNGLNVHIKNAKSGSTVHFTYNPLTDTLTRTTTAMVLEQVR